MEEIKPTVAVISNLNIDPTQIKELISVEITQRTDISDKTRVGWVVIRIQTEWYAGRHITCAYLAKLKRQRRNKNK